MGAEDFQKRLDDLSKNSAKAGCAVIMVIGLIVAVVLLVVVIIGLFDTANASTQTAPAEVARRDRLIADQEALLNVYRCRLGADTHLVPGGCDPHARETIPDLVLAGDGWDTPTALLERGAYMIEFKVIGNTPPDPELLPYFSVKAYDSTGDYCGTWVIGHSNEAAEWEGRGLFHVGGERHPAEDLRCPPGELLIVVKLTNPDARWQMTFTRR